MPELTDIREALAAALADIPGVDVSAWARSDPTPPCIDIFPGEAEYHLASANGLERWELIVRLFVALSTDRGAQERLDSHLAMTGVNSVKAAVEADRSLGGTVQAATVRRTTGYRTYTLGSAQAEALGAEWTVEVLT